MASSAVVAAFCSPWHATTSPAFHDLLVAPLQGLLDVRLIAWGSEPAPAASQAAYVGPFVFCQMLPPPELLNAPAARIVWVPMWDDLWQWTQTDWDRLPKHLRIVAYSEVVARHARRAGLPTLCVRFHCDPGSQPPVTWDNGVVVFYWNRTGLLGRHALTSLCRALGATKLLFRSRTDPGVPSHLCYHLPDRLGRTQVVSLPDWMERPAFEAAVSEANVVISPRAREGVGMLMLEAMACRCAVIGLDSATMNEYIRDGANGLLLSRAVETRWGQLRRRLTNRIRGAMGMSRVHFTERLASRVKWPELGMHDLSALGERAREDQAAGYAAWQSQLADLAGFLSEWP